MGCNATEGELNMNQDELIEYINEFESGEISNDRLILFFQYLVDTGKAWTLQGVYGRTAESLINQGLVKEKTT